MVKVALTGGAYQAHSVIASAQRSLNLFSEPLPTGNQYQGTLGQGEPTPVAHYPTPGLRLLGTIGTGPIRGIRQCTSGGVYVVSGDTLYSVNTSVWTGTALGTLTAGLRTPVSMQDNGLDMIVVDGTPNGWDVTLANNTFTPIGVPQVWAPVPPSATRAIAAGTGNYTAFWAQYDGSITTATVTLGVGFSGNLKCSIFASSGRGPTAALGSVGVITNPAAGSNTAHFSTPAAVSRGTQYWIGFDSDTSAGTWSVAAGATGLASATAYTAFPVASPACAAASAVVFSVAINNDPSGAFTGADHVDYLDTFFIFNKPNTPQFYISGSLAVTFDPLDFANKEAYSDLLVTLIVAGRLIYLFGTRTTEVWYDAGATDIGAGSFPFAAMQSYVIIDHGCAAKYSPAVFDSSVFWLTQNRQGQGFVMQASETKTKRISTYAIEAEIAGYERINDAIGFCYQLAGHAFYVLVFPHADKTWCYEPATGHWHEWGWIDINGAEHRHRANCFCPVNDTLVVGDWQNGNLYALDNRVFTDNGQPIKRVRSFPHMLNDGKRVFYRQFLADLETGNAPQVSVAAPAMAPYDVKLVQLNTNINGLWQSNTGFGFPTNTNFHTMLMSFWMCGPAATPGGGGTGVAGVWPEFLPAPFFSFDPAGTTSSNNISLTNQTLGSAAHFYQGSFNLPPPPGMLMHFMLSVDTHAQIVQVYINDNGAAVTGGTWTGSPPFNFNIRDFVNIWKWDVSGVINSGQYPALADVWISNTPSFVDLTVEANRRKFINADLSPVDLGDAGMYPFGYQPAMYMSVRPGGVPADILINRGIGGGSWNADAAPPTFQAPGACTLPPAPPPSPPPLWQNLISLRWSDDRGHSWGSPVTQDIGEAGEYRTSLQWQRLAYARDRVFELSWSVPMRTALQGAWIDVTPAQS